MTVSFKWGCGCGRVEEISAKVSLQMRTVMGEHRHTTVVILPQLKAFALSCTDCFVAISCSVQIRWSQPWSLVLLHVTLFFPSASLLFQSSIKKIKQRGEAQFWEGGTFPNNGVTAGSKQVHRPNLTEKGWAPVTASLFDLLLLLSISWGTSRLSVRACTYVSVRLQQR